MERERVKQKAVFLFQRFLEISVFLLFLSYYLNVKIFSYYVSFLWLGVFYLLFILTFLVYKVYFKIHPIFIWIYIFMFTLCVIFSLII